MSVQHQGAVRDSALDWKTELVVPLFKKGGRNYQWITLFMLPGKSLFHCTGDDNSNNCWIPESGWEQLWVKLLIFYIERSQLRSLGYLYWMPHLPCEVFQAWGDPGKDPHIMIIGLFLSQFFILCLVRLFYKIILWLEVCLEWIYPDNLLQKQLGLTIINVEFVQWWDGLLCL